jgi:hypothetical protein
VASHLHVIEIRDLVHHAVDVAGGFTGLDHVLHHRREEGVRRETSETCPPWLTCLAISEQASSIWHLPLAEETISRVRRMGTPERISVA